jgi:hypothetical protein
VCLTAMPRRRRRSLTIVGPLWRFVVGLYLLVSSSNGTVDGWSNSTSSGLVKWYARYIIIKRSMDTNARCLCVQIRRVNEMFYDAQALALWKVLDIGRLGQRFVFFPMCTFWAIF